MAVRGADGLSPRSITSLVEGTDMEHTGRNATGSNDRMSFMCRAGCGERALFCT
jgi:hypothetical protein